MAQKSGVQQHVGATTGHSVANITRALHGIGFPASKEEMITQAKHNHATKEAIEDIEKLANHEYYNIDQVLTHYGRR